MSLHHYFAYEEAGPASAFAPLLVKAPAPFALSVMTLQAAHAQFLLPQGADAVHGRLRRR
jgi:hypothetical protein